jgi:uncharacterized protein YjbI with pentapeptide repeats
MPPVDNPRVGERGYHLTADPLFETAGRRDQQRIFLAEYRGSIHVQGRRVAAESVRLIQEITPDWELLPVYPEIRVLLVSQWRKEFGTEPSLPAWADLSRAKLTGADLSWADLRGANLSEADLTRAHLTRAKLTQANLSGATLNMADLFGADLIRANLTRADLTGAVLTEADLTGANLTEANLYGAVLTEANLEGANLTEANLYGTVMTSAQIRTLNLSEKQKAQVRIVELRPERGVA